MIGKNTSVTSLFVLICMAAIVALIPSEALAFTSITTPPPTDKSIEYMRYIFGDAVNIIWYGAGPSSPDTILGAMSVVLNLGCLFFSGVIIGYTALVGVMNTANDGEVMGKGYSTMWVPIRTTLAIAIMLPTASGFSVMQLGVIWIAGQGVGLADTTWNAAVDFTDKKGTLYPAPVSFHGRELAQKMLHYGICMETLNRSYNETGSSADNPVKIKTKTLDPDWYDIDGIADKQYMALISYSGEGGWIDDIINTWSPITIPGTPKFSEAVCGGVRLELEKADTNYDDDYAIRSTLFNSIIKALKTAQEDTQTLARNLINPPGDFKPTGMELKEIYDKYNASHSAALVVATSDVADNYNADTGWVAGAKANGWIGAGSWYMSIMHLNDEAMALTKIKPLYLEVKTDEVSQTPDYEKAVDTMNLYLKGMFVSDGDGGVITQDEAATFGQTQGSGVSKVVASMDAAIQWSLDTEDPIIALQGIGHGLISSFETAYAIAAAAKIAAVTLSAAADSTVGQVLTLGTASVGSAALREAASMALSGLLYLGFLLLPLAFTLAFYLPVMPYLIWMMAVMGWFILLIEGSIAASLWAASHTLPEGNGAINNHAKAGYMIMLSLFIRPTLMLFGLMSSLVLMVVMGRVVLMTFIPMMTSVSSTGAIAGVGTLLAFLYLLTGLMISLSHRSYGLIHEIPDKVLRYISAQGETLGEAGAEREGRGTFSSGVHGMSKAAGDAVKSKKRPGGKPDKNPNKPPGTGDKKKTGQVGPTD